MKLKKVLSGFLSAAILATTTAIVMPMSASAEGDVVLGEMGNSDIAVSELGSATQAKITFNITTLDADGYGTMTAYVNGGSWNQRTYATAAQYASGAGQEWQANEEVTATGEQSITLDFSPANWGYQVGLKTSNPDAISGKLTKVEFLDASNNVVATHDATAESISKNNFTFSTLSNEEMSIGDSFTITFESDNTPASAKYSFKYKIPKVAEPTDSDYDYFAPVDNGEITEQGQSETGLKVTATNNGTKIIYKFEAIAASTAKYPFSVNVELSSAGDWSDTNYLWFGDISFFVPETNIPVKEVTVTPATLALKVGDAATALTATVTPEGADQGVTWTTSNNKVATVTADGKVTAVASGTATITATSTADETKKSECEVTVTNPATAIAIDKTASVLVGATKLLAVTTTPADADELTYTWITSDASIATVANGVVTGVTAGTAKITVTAGALTASCDVTVTAEEKPIAKLEISDATLELEEGKTGTLTSTTTPSDTTDEIEWVSSDPSVATVRDGVVTAVKAGKATITVQVKGNEEISASCEVTVTAKAPEIETKPYTLNVVDASGWGEAGVTRAAQVNVPVTTLNGFKVGTTTYKDVKDKTLKLENLAFGSCTAAGVKAENVDVCIYLQFGSGWTWCATGGNTLADGSVEYDLSTLASANGVKDTDVLQQIGFQFNIKGNVGGINDMAENTKVTLNAAEPKFTVVGEEPSNYETGKVETVEGYVPASTEAGKKTELVVMSITETEAARNDSYTITVSDGTKTYTTTTNDCYKGFKYNTATGEKTENAANGYFIIVKVTGVPEGTNITVTIEPTK